MYIRDWTTLSHIVGATETKHFKTLCKVNEADMFREMCVCELGMYNLRSSYGKKLLKQMQLVNSVFYF